MKAVQFLTIILVAVMLVPGGAHLFALANKIGMERDAYFTVQQIYRGWALFGIPLLGALAASLALAVSAGRRGPRSCSRPPRSCCCLPVW